MHALILILLAGTANMSSTGRAASSGTAAPDYFTSLFAGTITNDCAGTALTMSGGETVTCTRASSAYCTKADGTLVALTSNKCRANTANGFLVESGRTNLTTDNFDFSDADTWSSNGFTAVTANTTVAPDGTSTADTLTLNAGSTSAGQNFIYMMHPETADVVYTRTVYLEAGTVAYVTIYGSTNGLQSRYSTFHLSGAGSVLVDNGGSVGKIARVGSTNAYRVETRATATSTVTSFFIIVYGDTQAHALPGTTWTAAGTESIKAWGAQTEAGEFASSLIASGGTATARAADNVSFTPSQAIASEGCARVTVTFPADYVAGGRIIDVGSSSSIILYWNTAMTVAIYDGNTVTSASTGASAMSRTLTIRAAWGGASKTVEVVGEGSNTGAFDGSMDGADSTIHLGSVGGSAAHIEGYLKDLRLGTSATGCQ